MAISRAFSTMFCWRPSSYVENRTVRGPATARRRSELGNRRSLLHGQLSSDAMFACTVAVGDLPTSSVSGQRGPAGPRIRLYGFCPFTSSYETCYNCTATLAPSGTRDPPPPRPPHRGRAWGSRSVREDHTFTPRAALRFIGLSQPGCRVSARIHSELSPGR